MARRVLGQGAHHLDQVLHGQRRGQRVRRLDLEHQLRTRFGVGDDRHQPFQRLAHRALGGPEAGHPSAGQLGLDHATDSGDGAVQPLGGVGGALVAGAAAQGRQGGQRGLQPMGQVTGPAARAGQVALAGLGQGVDGLDQRLDLAGVGARQPFGGIALQAVQFAPDGGQGGQAEADLSPGGGRQHGPEQQQEEGQLTPKLAARGGDGGGVGGHLHQHGRSTTVRAHQPLDHEQALAEGAGQAPRAPVARLGQGRGGQGLVPQRARAQRSGLGRNLPIEAAGGVVETRIRGRGVQGRLAVRLHAEGGDQLQAVAGQVFGHPALDMALEQHGHGQPGHRQRREDRHHRPGQQPQAQGARLHAPASGSR